jgi:hypothetical protein
MSEPSNEMPTAQSSLPVTHRPTDRLRDQLRLDRELADRSWLAKPRPADNLAYGGAPSPRGNLDRS